MENKNNMNVIVAVIICLVVAGILVFISIRNKANNSANNNMNTNTEPVTTNSGADNTPAPSPAPQVAKTGDTVAMNYTGRLQDGTVFDSNVDAKFNHVQPFEFTLGAGQVISGWDKGIVGMKVGEKKTLTIPPADAYGAQGIPGVIPPNSTLVFDVQLLAIKK